MNIDFELALSRLANDPTDLIAWSVILDAFNNKIANTRTINGKNLISDIVLDLDSSDFANQGTTTTVLHGNASGNPSWGSIVTNDITDFSVTVEKMQQIPTARILGRLNINTGLVEILTGTEATTLLELFKTDSTLKGLVPGSNSVGTSYFLRADGTWAIPTNTVHSSLSNLSYAASGHTGFEPSITAGTTGQYYRGDKTWQTLPSSTSVWGAITGTLANQTDLQAVLDLKAPVNSPTFTGTVTGTFSGNITGNVTGNADTATNATNATNTGITNDVATNASMFLTWVTANTGNLPQKVSSTKLWFNPSTAILYCSGDIIAYSTP